MVNHDTLNAAAKYGPAMLAVPFGTVDPKIAAIMFGMLAGWFAIAGVMVEQRKSITDIRRAMIVSVLIGGGGALCAAFAVDRLHLTSIEASLIAFAIAFGGVKSIKMFANAVGQVVSWVARHIVNDAVNMGSKKDEQ